MVDWQGPYRALAGLWRRRYFQVCGGKIVSILEGGYDLQAISDSAVAHVRALREASSSTPASTPTPTPTPTPTTPTLSTVTPATTTREEDADAAVNRLTERLAAAVKIDDSTVPADNSTHLTTKVVNEVGKGGATTT